ncbi:MAG: NmrA family transcriptional regulator [Anaerolineaceae bacterium]|nr:NmrA family transcriptional regulator [Anaerolineaceae bacterium]
MKLTIFGATGGTGQELVKQALADGHVVTVYVRNPDKVTQEMPQLTVIQGNMNEPENIEQAIAGADAILSALGPTNNTPERPLTTGMAHIVTAMKKNGVNRLIAATGAGVADPRDKPQLKGLLFGLALRLFARHVLADSQGMVAAVRNSGLDWTLARAPRLNDDPGSGQIKVGYAGQGPGTQLARTDFARFMLDQLESDEWRQKAPMLSN